MLHCNEIRVCQITWVIEQHLGSVDPGITGVCGSRGSKKKLGGSVFRHGPRRNKNAD